MYTRILMRSSYSSEGRTNADKLKLACKSKINSVYSSPVFKSFLAGALSGTCSTVLFQPLDLLKTKLQAPIKVGHHGHTGLFKTFVRVIEKEKIFGLWRGLVPSIARCVPGVGLYFCFLYWLKTTTGYLNPSPLQAVCLGAASRALAGSALLPVTVVKTRFESGRFNYKGVTGAIRDIYRSEGARGLYSGTVATLMRDVPFSGLYLMFYLQTKQIIKPDRFSNSATPAVNFGCGIVAGILASGLTQPADVIKTHMQLFPHRYTGTIHATKAIIKVHGPQGLLRGMLPRCLRRTLMAAMAWTVYEQAMKMYGLK